MVVMPLNPPGQYADDRNLRARQRFWQHQSPYFDIVGWVLELGVAFRPVACVRPEFQPPVIIRDAQLAAGFVSSWASFYQHETTRPWPEVVQDVRQDVQAVIERQGVFITYGDVAAFVCR